VAAKERAAAGGPIAPWRFVAGILLHCAVPAFLVWLAAALLPLFAGGAAPDRLAAAAGHASVVFLIAYAVLLVAAILVTRALEPALRQARARREARDPASPARESRRRVETALRAAHGLGGGARLRQATARLEAAPWDHDDDRCQAVSADLARAAEAFAAAARPGAASAPAELEALAAASLERLAEAVEEIGAERRRLDQGDAEAMARYIALRYPASDFAGDENR